MLDGTKVLLVGLGVTLLGKAMYNAVKWAMKDYRYFSIDMVAEESYCREDVVEQVTCEYYKVNSKNYTVDEGDDNNIYVMMNLWDADHGFI